jgi:hypothetical protein
MTGDDRTRSGQLGDDRVGDRRGGHETEKREGGELKWFQSVVLMMWSKRS